jgi:hypothetical protein
MRWIGVGFSPEQYGLEVGHAECSHLASTIISEQTRRRMMHVVFRIPDRPGCCTVHLLVEHCTISRVDMVIATI